MKSPHRIGLLTLLIGVGLVGLVCGQTVWSLAGDFSAGSPTSGAWSYGSTPTLAGSFTLYDTSSSNSGLQS